MSRRRYILIQAPDEFHAALLRALGARGQLAFATASSTLSKSRVDLRSSRITISANLHFAMPSRKETDLTNISRHRFRGGGRLQSRECPQIVTHDRASRRAASDFLEANARERRGCANKDIRRALRCARVDGISLERRCPRTLCGLHGRGDKLSHDSLPAIVPAHEETGDRPHGQIVHTLEPPHAVKPRERIARRELAPAHRQIAVESEQPRRWTARHEPS